MPTTVNIKQEKWDKNKNLTSKAFEIYRSQICKELVNSVDILITPQTIQSWIEAERSKRWKS